MCRSIIELNSVCTVVCADSTLDFKFCYCSQFNITSNPPFLNSGPKPSNLSILILNLCLCLFREYSLHDARVWYLRFENLKIRRSWFIRFNFSPMLISSSSDVLLVLLTIRTMYFIKVHEERRAKNKVWSNLVCKSQETFYTSLWLVP